MKLNTALRKWWLVAGTMMFALALQAQAATEKDLGVQANRMDVLSASRGETVVSDKISGDFSSFAGSQENAQALVSGLRNGGEIKLTSATAPSESFTPPTGKMGYGNVFISLSVAKQSLAMQGIAQPTPEQLRTAMLGGQIVTSTGKTVQMQGVLAMRADGMGWGQIANNMGFKLGQAVSAIKSTNTQLGASAAHIASPPGKGGISTPTSAPAASGKSGQTPGKGIVTGTGESPGAAVSGKGGQGGISGAGSSGAGRGYGKGGDGGRGQGSGKP